MYIAKWVSKITVIDPDTKGEVELEVYKHPNGGIFAIDSSFLEQCTDEDTYPVVPDPFTNSLNKGEDVVMLSDV
jgi:hypothetical protein